MSYKEYLNIVEELPKHRGIEIKSKKFNENDFLKEMNRDKYVNIKCLEKGEELMIVLVGDIVGADNIRGLIHSFTKSTDSIHNVIIISDEKRKESIVKFSDSEKYDYTDVRYYNHNHMKICFPKSDLVPKHIILTPEEASRVKNIHMLNNSEFPIISSKDPLSLWLGFKPGDLIMIERVSENSGTNIMYRMCQ